MGEAKRNLEATRAAFLAELDRWTFPATEWEANAIAEVAALPTIRVRRYPDDVLKQMGMPPKHCHANARFMADNDPEGKCRQVTGWWMQQGNYVLHSVVEREGVYFCVTPTPLHPEDTFDFTPDPKVEWRDEGDFRNSYRDGVETGPGLRIDPAASLAEIDQMRARLNSGMNPYRAVQHGPDGELLK